MAKAKSVEPLDPMLRAPALALRAFEREIERVQDSAGSPLARQDYAQLASVHSYTILLFLADFASADLSEKQFARLLARYDVNTPGNRKIFPNLSQSALFEVFGGIGVSRETIRRLLILLSQYGLVDRISKGPPFPDQLTIAKQGTKLVNKVSKKLAKDLAKEKAFAYL